MNTQSHSKEFIEEMKNQLLKEQKELMGELDEISHAGADGNSSQHEANFPDYGRDDESNATEVADYEVRNTVTAEADGRLAEIADALSRIEDGSYGVTEDGEVIPENRLRANPAATTLVKKPE